MSDHRYAVVSRSNTVWKRPVPSEHERQGHVAASNSSGSETRSGSRNGDDNFYTPSSHSRSGRSSDSGHFHSVTSQLEEESESMLQHAREKVEQMLIEDQAQHSKYFEEIKRLQQEVQELETHQASTYAENNVMHQRWQAEMHKNDEMQQKYDKLLSSNHRHKQLFSEIVENMNNLMHRIANIQEGDSQSDDDNSGSDNHYSFA